MIKQFLESKKLWLIIGIVLILVGVLLSFLLIKHQYDDCAYRWDHNLDGFGFKYASAWDCFVTRSTGAIMLFLAAGFVPLVIGCCLIRRSRES